MREWVRKLRAAQSRRLLDSVGADVQWRGTAEKRGGGTIRIGAASIIESELVCNRPEARIDIGARSFLGGGVKLDCLECIAIGDDVLIAYETVLADHDAHSILWAERARDVSDWAAGVKHWDAVRRAPILIGDKCWIGARCLILKGVTLGEGCVVAAGSVVTKSFPASSLLGGNPARLLRVIEQDL